MKPLCKIHYYLLIFLLPVVFSSCNGMTCSPVPNRDLQSANDSFLMGETYGSVYWPANILQTFSRDFEISIYEITNSDFRRFVDAGGYTNSGYWTTSGWQWKTLENWQAPKYWPDGDSPDPAYCGDDQPVVGISWYEAVAYCNWLSLYSGYNYAYSSNGSIYYQSTDNGYRLPTEVEWEYAAAKGDPSESERIYAWGDAWNCTRAVSSVVPCSHTQPANVGSASPDGDTPQGVTDMSGNVQEWCSDNYQQNSDILSATDRYFFSSDIWDEVSGITNFFVVRNGGFDMTIGDFYRCAFRDSFSPITRDSRIGFRVVRTLD